MFFANGTVLTYQHITQVLGVKTNQMEYNSIVSAVKKYQRFCCIDVANIDSYCPVIPTLLIKLRKGRRGCRDICTQLHTFTECELSKAQLKWSEELNLTPQFLWSDAFSLPFVIFKDTKIRWFQYRILHRILTTNRFLKIIKIADSDLCSYCNKYPETLKHLFYDCKKVNIFWNEVLSEILHKCVADDLDMPSYKDVIFGRFDEKSTLLNIILLLGKQFIYNSKNCTVLHLENFVNFLIQYYNCEKVIAMKTSKIEHLRNRWTNFEEKIVGRGEGGDAV